MRTTIAVTGMLVLTTPASSREIAPAEDQAETSVVTTEEAGTTSATGGAGSTPAEEAQAAQSARAEADIRAVQERLAELQSELAALRAQVEIRDQQLAAMQQAIEEDRARQRESESNREERIAAANETIGILIRAQQVLETGSDDVADALQGASERLAWIAEGAMLFGGEAEAREALEGQAAVAQVRSALERRDFHDAKLQVIAAIYRTQQALSIAESYAHPLGRQ